MVQNPITEEIREIRHRLAAQFDNDVSRIGAETRRRQVASGRRVIRRPIINHDNLLEGMILGQGAAHGPNHQFGPIISRDDNGHQVWN